MPDEFSESNCWDFIFILPLIGLHLSCIESYNSHCSMMPMATSCVYIVIFV